MKKILSTIILAGLMVMSSLPVYSHETKLQNGISVLGPSHYNDGTVVSMQQAWQGVPFTVLPQLADISPGPDTSIKYKDGVLLVVGGKGVLDKVNKVVESLSESVPFRPLRDTALRSEGKQIARLTSSWRVPTAFLTRLREQTFEWHDGTTLMLTHDACLYLMHASEADTEMMQQLVGAYIQEHGEAKLGQVTPLNNKRSSNHIPDPKLMLRSWVVPQIGKRDQNFIKGLIQQLEAIGGKMGGSADDCWNMNRVDGEDGIYDCVITARMSDDKKMEQFCKIIADEKNRYYTPQERTWQGVSRGFLISGLEAMPENRSQLAVEGLKAKGIRFDNKESTVAYDAKKKTLTARLIKPQLERLDTLVKRSQALGNGLRNSRTIKGKVSESARVYALYCLREDLSKLLVRVENDESTQESIQPTADFLEYLRKQDGVEPVMLVRPNADKKLVEKVCKIFKVKDPVMVWEASVWGRLDYMEDNYIFLLTADGNRLESDGIMCGRASDYDKLRQALEQYLSKRKAFDKSAKKKKKKK